MGNVGGQCRRTISAEAQGGAAQTHPALQGRGRQKNETGGHRLMGGVGDVRRIKA